MTIQTSLETITPDMAAAMLEKNTGNRNLKEKHIQRIASDLKEGRWHWNGASIVLNGDGTILDGQHRLMAIVRSGVPAQTMVVRGLSKSVQPTIDSNITRKANDVLTMRGVPYSTRVAALVRMAVAVNNGWVAPANMSNTSVLDFVDQNPDVLKAVADTDAVCKFIPSSIASTWYYFAITSGLRERAKAALTVLESGIPEYEGDPIHAFRERMLRIEPTARNGHTVRLSLLYTLIGAWNNFAVRKSVKRIQISTGPVAPIGWDYIAA